jgi:hypothetical protein
MEKAFLTQLEEYLHGKQKVIGSIPIRGYLKKVFVYLK